MQYVIVRRRNLGSGDLLNFLGLADWLSRIFGSTRVRSLKEAGVVPSSADLQNGQVSEIEEPTNQPAIVSADNLGSVLPRPQFVLPADRQAMLRAFDASRPISGRSELFGRRREIESLLESVFDINQHAIIYGARGSGKTSVARVFGDFADQYGAVVLYFPCEPDANFAQLMGALLDGIPPGSIASEARSDFKRKLIDLPAHFGPSALVDLIAGVVIRPVVLILDEFDRIANVKVKTDIAVAMKLLSDAHSEIRIVLVGIAASISDILIGHPSLRRHMSVTRLGSIDAGSVDALISHGAAIAGMTFEQPARDLISRISLGSPYHVRLLCRHAVLEAIRGRTTCISLPVVGAAVKSVYEQWKAANESDACAFEAVAGDVKARPLLEDLAREVARDNSFTAGPKFAAVTRRLGESVSASCEGSAQFLFNDSLAPQFLVASLFLEEMRTSLLDAPEGFVDVAAQ